MSRRSKEPRVVAELGRPETPEETAARKAENSRNHRDRQTTRNLVYALLASLGIVAVLVLLVPRGDMEARPDVDYPSIAAQIQPTVQGTLIVPEPGEGWNANTAELRAGSADNILSWYIGFLTPKNAFIGLDQGFDANDSWASAQLDSARPTGATTIAGVEWIEYDYTESPRGNLAYALTLDDPTGFYVLKGTASKEETAVLAAAVTERIASNR